MPEKVDPDSGVATESQSERKLKRPQLYKVLFHNDNYTTRDFVVAVLREVFHKSESDAVAIMRTAVVRLATATPVAIHAPTRIFAYLSL